MASDEVGSAYIAVRAKTDGFKRDVEAAVESADTSRAGAAAGDRAASGFAGGLARSGAVMGAVSALATKAFDTVSSSLGSAVKRVDTIANFPKVMKNMAIGTDAAEVSISKLSDDLAGLPTTLDSAAAGVQRFTSKNNDIARSTDMFLAVNDAVLAGGAPLAQQSEALEQLSQAYAKGQMDMMEWRTLQMAMPAQLNQVAQAMGMTTEQLGAGLRQAEKDASFLREISMDEFIDQIMRLDKEGAAGFASFEEQAKSATAGIETAMENLQTAVVRGEAKIIDTIGQENISGAINEISSGVNGLAGDIANGVKASVDAVKPLVPGLKNIAGGLAAIAPAAIQAWAAFKLFQGGRALFGAMSAGAAGVTGKINSLGLQTLLLGNNMASAGKMGAGAMQSIGRAMTGLSVAQFGGYAAVAAGLAYATVNLANAFEKARKHQEDLNLATRGFSAAVSGIVSPTNEAASVIDAVSEKAKSARLDMDAFMDSQVQHAQSVITLRDSLNEQVNTLSSARETIAAYAGQTNLSAAEMAAYRKAVDDVNAACGTQFRIVEDANNALSAADGSYDAAASAAGEYASQLDNVIEKKKEEARVNAAAAALEEGYAARTDALGTYTDAVKNYHDQVAAQQEQEALGNDRVAEGMQANVDHAKQAMDEAKAVLDARNADIKTLEANLDNAGSAAQNASSALMTLANTTGFDKMLAKSGYTVDQFGAAIEEAGVKVETLAALSPQQLATMADRFQGESENIVSYLKSIDTVTIGDKTFRVDDHGTIYDGETRLGDLNGFQVGDKHYWVTSDGTVMSEQGAVGNLTNAIGGVPNGQYHIDGNASQATGEVDFLTAAINRVPREKIANVSANVNGVGDVWNLVNAISNVRSKVVSVVANAFGLGGSAVGGVSGTPWDLSGAYVPRMAMGGIVTRPTLTNNGWVGEDGAEAVMNWGTGGAVIPLTNRRYMLPIAKAIASSMPGQSAPTSITFVVNGASNPEQFARQTMRKVGQIQRAR